MKSNILVLGSNNFNKSMKELEQKLELNLIICNLTDTSLQSDYNSKILLLEREFMTNNKINLSSFKDFDLPILLVSNLNNFDYKNIPYNDLINLPLNIFDLKKKIIDLIAAYKFNINSSIKIKNYLIDKNSREMKNQMGLLNLTEKEINLLELLNQEKKPISKKIILNQIWKYSVDADTHTVETHIYRLRKKILDKFNDENFIKIVKGGYSL
jgi:hypothetical protein